MKRLSILLALFTIAISQAAAVTPAKVTGVFNVLDYGAVNNGKTVTTKAIQEAIDKCNKNGGGVVTIPQGEYLVGTINLRSNVEVHFENGATLKATTDLKQYQRHNLNLAGVFYTENADNIAITGNGVIFGQGMKFMHDQLAKRLPESVLALTRQKSKFRTTADGGIGDGPVEPKDRFHQMLVFSNCTNVRLTDFKCVDAPYWTFVLAHCQRVRVKGLTIDNNLLIPNSDGMDFCSCNDVNVSDCMFYCGDDALVITGYAHHQGDPGFQDIMRPAGNFNVSDCVLQSRSSGIRIGLWEQNELSNLNFSNIVIKDSNCGIGIAVRDSGSVSHVNFSNVRIETRLHTGDWWGNGEPIKLTVSREGGNQKIGTIRDVNFTNVSCRGENSILLWASDGYNINDVRFTNFDFTLCQSEIEDVAGGNYDIRPTDIASEALFAHDTPIVFLKNANNVKFLNGTLRLDRNVTKDYFKPTIEAVNAVGLITTEVTTETNR